MPRLLNDDVTRLARSAERLVRLVEEISKRRDSDSNTASASQPESAPASAPFDHTITDSVLEHAAREAIAAHTARPHFGHPALFQDRTWVLMLELFLAGLAGRRTPVTNACLSLGGAQTTALRAILELERRDLVHSSTDETDGRRRLIGLSPACEAQLRNYLMREPPRGRTMRLAVRMRTQGIADEPQHRAAIECSGSANAPHPVRTGCGGDVILQ